MNTPEIKNMSVEMLEQWLTILDQEIEQGDAAIEGFKNAIKQTRLNNEHTVQFKRLVELAIAAKKPTVKEE